MKVLVLSGGNHQFESSAAVINDFLSLRDDMSVTLTNDKNILASSELNQFDACVFGTGFTRTVRQEDGTLTRQPELTPKQEDGFFHYIHDGKGLVGIHGTAWWIGGRAVDLIGGHSNWHPPGSTFTVKIEDSEHSITQDLDDFEVEDEIYISAYDPYIHILASAEWHNRSHPMAWTKDYGKGRVFYTTLGHSSDTFERPAMQQLISQGVAWAAKA
ncbi:TPA: ThuA domain-containing protein [Candidatus Poribacteria bacterium]|nr:ThuA domain-containing protein [Candidatus Poribacteria bacterium]